MATVAKKTLQPSLDANCERIIAQFEHGNVVDAITFTRESLERIDPAWRPALVTELARIDLERNFSSDYLHEVSWKPSELYQSFGQLLEDSSLRAQVAFEHYRLARLYGKPVTRQQIGTLYAVAGDAWKELPLGNPSGLKVRQEPQFPRIGEIFSGYSLIAELGRGALARVYLARQPDLASRLVVLKVSGRLNAEADKLARLQHTNIVPVYSVHRGEGPDENYAICMPYLGSLTLADLLLLFEGQVSQTCRIEELISTLVARRRSTLVSTTLERNAADNAVVDASKPASEKSDAIAPADAAPFASRIAQHDSHASVRFDRQLGYEELMGALHSLVKRPNDMHSACWLIEGIASGMAYAHSLGIVHRDLKPENVLIANDGRPVILDFNLSDEPTGGRPEIVGGTLPYMSLQQLQSLDGTIRASPSDDVFAIGTIFYRLLTGQMPFATHSIDHLTRLVEERSRLPTPVRKLAPHVPASLSAMVMKCLEADEQLRYPSAKELLEDLICFREHRTLRHAADRSLVERIHRIITRHPLITSTSFLSTVATALLLMLGVSWWWSTQHAQQLTQQLHLRQLTAAMPEVLSKLHGPNREATQLQSGVAEAVEALASWHISVRAGDAQEQLTLLSPAERAQALDRLGQLTFAVASAEGNLALLETESTLRDQHLQAALRWNRMTAELSPQLTPACRFQRSQIQPEPKEPGSASPPNADEALADTPLAKLLLARQKGDIGDWLHWAEVMTSDHPEDATVWFNLGAAQYTAGSFHKAWANFDVAAKLQSSALNSVFWRGVASHQLGEYARALADFERCVKADPKWVAARHNRALAAFALQELDAAMADATYMIDQQYAGPRVWLLRAQIDRLQGRTEQAQQDRQSAMTAKCFSADDWGAIGVQKIASSPEEALQAFRQARQVEPNNVAALQNSAHVLSEQLQQLDQAIEPITRLIALRPKAAGNYATRGILAARLNRETAALQDADHAASLQPTAIEMVQLAGIYSLLSRGPDAGNQAKYLNQSLEWLRHALADDPQLVMIIDQDPDTKAVRDQPVCKELLASAHMLIKK